MQTVEHHDAEFVHDSLGNIWCMFTKQKSMQACTKTHHFEIKNAKNFVGRGTPLPRPQRLRCLDLRAYGAQAQRDTPEKNPSYGLGENFRSRGTFVPWNINSRGAKSPRTFVPWNFRSRGTFAAQTTFVPFNL